MTYKRFFSRLHYTKKRFFPIHHFMTNYKLHHFTLIRPYCLSFSLIFVILIVKYVQSLLLLPWTVMWSVDSTKRLVHDITFSYFLLLLYIKKICWGCVDPGTKWAKAIHIMSHTKKGIYWWRNIYSLKNDDLPVSIIDGLKHEVYIPKRVFKTLFFTNV